MLSSWLSRSAGEKRPRKPAPSLAETAAKRVRAARPSAQARTKAWFARLGWLVALAMLGALSVLAWRRGQSFVQSGFFAIRTVQVQGLSAEMDREIERAAGLDRLQGRNLLYLDARRLEERIARHPRIETVRVDKVYPNTVQISASERKAVALINADRVYWIDRNGILLDRASSALDEHEDLPFINGVKVAPLNLGDRVENSGLASALDLIARMKQLNPQMYRSVGEIRADDPNSLILYLRGGLEVRLPAQDPVGRMPELERFLETCADLDQVSYINLCIEGQIVHK
ncbi:MAG: cell division protein FtsQ [candidate division BRC1 bacterium ADurb.BinA364]|nr:MAG: cell division protein FtsQ [candidate division BRC1 bacterium ADurb.BinA364]